MRRRAPANDVERALARIAGLPEDEVRPSSHLRSDLGLDFYDTAELVGELERLFGTRVPDERLEELETVEDVERAIR